MLKYLQDITRLSVVLVNICLKNSINRDKSITKRVNFKNSKK